MNRTMRARERRSNMQSMCVRVCVDIGRVRLDEMIANSLVLDFMSESDEMVILMRGSECH